MNSKLINLSKELHKLGFKKESLRILKVAAAPNQEEIIEEVNKQIGPIEGDISEKIQDYIQSKYNANFGDNRDNRCEIRNPGDQRCQIRSTPRSRAESRVQDLYKENTDLKEYFDLINKKFDELQNPSVESKPQESKPQITTVYYTGDYPQFNNEERFIGLKISPEKGSEEQITTSPVVRHKVLGEGKYELTTAAGSIYLAEPFINFIIQQIDKENIRITPYVFNFLINYPRTKESQMTLDSIYGLLQSNASKQIESNMIPTIGSSFSGKIKSINREIDTSPIIHSYQVTNANTYIIITESYSVYLVVPPKS